MKKRLISLLELTDETCRWPIGDPLEAGFGFCGEHPVEGKVYCAKHQARAYGVGTESERTAVKVAAAIARAA